MSITSRSESSKDGRERDGEHCRPEEARCHGPAHADFSVAQREHLSRVGERHRTLAWRVERCEEVDEERNQSQVRLAVVRDVEAEAGCEQSPGHVRESEQEQRPAAKGVDGPDGWLSYLSVVDRNTEEPFS